MIGYRQELLSKIKIRLDKLAYKKIIKRSNFLS